MFFELFGGWFLVFLYAILMHMLGRIIKFFIPKFNTGISLFASSILILILGVSFFMFFSSSESQYNTFPLLLIFLFSNIFVGWILAKWEYIFALTTYVFTRPSAKRKLFAHSKDDSINNPWWSPEFLLGTSQKIDAKIKNTAFSQGAYTSFVATSLIIVIIFFQEKSLRQDNSSWAGIIVALIVFPVVCGMSSYLSLYLQKTKKISK